MLEPIYPGKGKSETVYKIMVITQPADSAIEFLSNITKTLSKDYDWVETSQASPIYLNSILNYTFTITMGYYPE